MLQRLAMILMLAISLWITTAMGNSDRLAFACECLAPKPPLASLEEGNVVFSGKVIDLETTDDPYPSRVVTFDVYTVWKGITKDSVKVTTGMGGADCGYDFEENKDYLVYAYGDPESEVGTDYCSRTKPLDKAEADLAAIGEGRDVSKALLYSPEIWSYPNPSLLVGIAVGVVGAIIAGVLITRRRSKNV